MKTLILLFSVLFTTMSFAQVPNCHCPPAVTTTAVLNITNTSASSGGAVTSDGGAAVTAWGVCWSTSPNPTLANSFVQNNVDFEGFSSELTGLTLNTTYYVRSYVTNSAGTAYGNQQSFTTLNGAIGSSYQGGIVAYILQPGDPGYDANVQHGLIAAPSVWYYYEYWAPLGCLGTEIPGADGTAIGTGNQNTIDIMTGCSEVGIAARLCGDLVLNGYSDWYLPSIDELNQLYLNRVAIGGFASSLYSFYLSSTDIDNNAARTQDFYDGFLYNLMRNNYSYFRPVRAF